MKPFALYCKSYRTDLRRVQRLAESVRAHNVDQLPFYVSVPRADLPLFREHLGALPLVLLADEDILQACRLSSSARSTSGRAPSCSRTPRRSARGTDT
ncbi:MAG: hypothetical protein ACK5RC_04595 [Curvibacter sp.]